jgi:hypothetical protein
MIQLLLATCDKWQAINVAAAGITAAEFSSRRFYHLSAAISVSCRFFNVMLELVPVIQIRVLGGFQRNVLMAFLGITYCRAPSPPPNLSVSLQAGRCSGRTQTVSCSCTNFVLIARCSDWSFSRVFLIGLWEEYAKNSRKEVIDIVDTECLLRTCLLNMSELVQWVRNMSKHIHGLERWRNMSVCVMGRSGHFVHPPHTLICERHIAAHRKISQAYEKNITHSECDYWLWTCVCVC